ncbi:hypothetical protein BDV95DRAFT_627627 [Massariosphaeria phaeospora]|uniref:Zn(2)-C6 fungal-type domain-containing protein n=1 Tax=Massariosphaeria phaeospora TaxID=100035 RepID=A0A7C8IBD4_9PLEO|nr:hypothetical protein BDV95DRAFT_627627 [Massariosphaeria phaeospora]
MARRSAGFVSKKPHKKSRGGCLSCKRKKVKCDEALPACGYCALRKLECNYPQGQAEESPTASSTDLSTALSNTPSSQLDDSTDFNNISVEIPSWLIPAAITSVGQLTGADMKYLHHYKTSTWSTMTMRNEEVIHRLNRDWVPQASILQPYLLYAILSIAAAHSNSLCPSGEAKNAALIYRQKMFAAYNKALRDITADNYETLLMTAYYMIMLCPPPDQPCDDDTYMDWIVTFLSMMQGIRILASLKWATGIEKLNVFPLFKRELRPLPSAPVIELHPDPRLYTRRGPLGTTPEHPDPAPLYETASPVASGLDMSNLPFRPVELMSAGTSPHAPAAWKKPHSWQLPAPAFLPPPLLALLKSLVDPPDSEPIDIHCESLLPVLHAMSPIFLSLYYYHINPDAHVRITVIPTFLPQEFLTLLREREPRALVIISWWFAFVTLLPQNWYVVNVVPRILQATSNVVMRCNNKLYMDAMEGAYRVVTVTQQWGKEAGARSLFDGWDGVNWDDGPRKEEEHRNFEEFCDIVEEGTLESITWDVTP